MHRKIREGKHLWLMVLAAVYWFMAGTFIYGLPGGDDEIKGPGVILYKHAEFKGSRIFVEAGRSIKDLNDIGWNDKISSIELVDKVRIRIYEHKNYRGASVTISDDIPDLAEFTENIGGNWNDIISSIKVLHTGYLRDDSYDENRVYCIFYKHADGRGSSFEGTLGGHHKIKSGWNDKVSSIWIRRGYKVILYEHDNYRGKQLTLVGRGLKGSSYNLSPYGFNDIVSSYKLERSRR